MLKGSEIVLKPATFSAPFLLLAAFTSYNARAMSIIQCSTQICKMRAACSEMKQGVPAVCLPFNEFIGNALMGLARAPTASPLAGR